MVLLNYYKSVANRLRRIFLKLRGVSIKSKSFIASGVSIPRFPSNVEIGKNTFIDEKATLLISAVNVNSAGKIVVGDNVYINRYFFADCMEQIIIGDGCMIGPYVYITDGDHNFKCNNELRNAGMVTAKVVIGKNVWIGAHAVILKGVSIGDNAVIAAGAVVTKDVLTNTVVKGIPAK